MAVPPNEPDWMDASPRLMWGAVFLSVAISCGAIVGCIVYIAYRLARYCG